MISSQRTELGRKYVPRPCTWMATWSSEFWSDCWPGCPTMGVLSSLCVSPSPCTQTWWQVWLVGQGCCIYTAGQWSRRQRSITWHLLVLTTVTRGKVGRGFPERHLHPEKGGHTRSDLRGIGIFSESWSPNTLFPHLLVVQVLLGCLISAMLASNPGSTASVPFLQVLCTNSCLQTHIFQLAVSQQPKWEPHNPITRLRDKPHPPLHHLREWFSPPPEPQVENLGPSWCPSSISSRQHADLCFPPGDPPDFPSRHVHLLSGKQGRLLNWKNVWNMPAAGCGQDLIGVLKEVG